jgi:O-antigen/teichoic acid export membrane protein
VLISSTLALAVGFLLAEPLSQLILGTSDATLMSAGVFGIWAFTNLEMAYALLRVSDRRRAYLIASSTNVILTVSLTVTLVVFLDEGARGYVLGDALALVAAFFVSLHPGWAPEEHLPAARAAE